MTLGKPLKRKFVWLMAIALFPGVVFSEELTGKELGVSKVSGRRENMRVAAYRGASPNLSHRSVAPPPEPSTPGSPSGADPKFLSAYNRAGRPRIMILFNEILEREYQDYRSGRRWVWQDTVQGKLTGGFANKVIGLKKGPDSKKTASLEKTKSSFDRNIDLNRRRAVTQEVRIARTRRSAPVEWDTLRARQVFTEPFLGAGVQLIDPNLAVRSFASQSSASTSKSSSRVVEFSAWKQFADIIIEFLFVWDSGQRKWQISVKGIEIPTGRIISIATSHQKEDAEAIFPGQGSGSPQPSYMSGPPSRETNGVEESRKIAAKIMNQMAAAWANMPRAEVRSIRNKDKNQPPDKSDSGKSGGRSN